MNDLPNSWLDDTVRREGNVMFSAHPSAEDLALFTESEAKLTAEHRREIKAHLRVCAACDDDCARLRAASLELENGERISPAAPSRDLVNRLKEWFAPSVWVPAIVAVAITVAILGPDSDQPIVHSVGQAVVLRSDIERGAAPTVTPDIGGHLVLSFVLSGTGEGAIDHCDVTIATADGAVVTTVTGVTAFDQYGTFVLTINARNLSSGSYILTAQDRIGTRQFAFDLQHPSMDTSGK